MFLYLKRQEFFLKFFPSDFKLTRHSQSGSAWHPMVVLILFSPPKNNSQQSSVLWRDTRNLSRENIQNSNISCDYLFPWGCDKTCWDCASIGKNPTLAKLTLRWKKKSPKIPTMTFYSLFPWNPHLAASSRYLFIQTPLRCSRPQQESFSAKCRQEKEEKP